MPKQVSNQTSLRRFQLLQAGSAVELLMIALYRWQEVSWLIIPIIVLLACLMTLGLWMAPRLFGAVFGAIFAALVAGGLVSLFPLLLLLNTDSEPNPVTVTLLLVWIVAFGATIVFVYFKTERYLMKRLGVKGGTRPKL